MWDNYTPRLLTPGVLQIGEICTKQGSHRAHETIVDVLAIMLATQKAIDATSGRTGGWSQSDWARTASIVFPDTYIAFPTHGILEAVVTNANLTYTKLGIVRLSEDVNKDVKLVNKLHSFVSRVAYIYFSAFFDPWIDWLKANVSTDLHKWPPVLSFARIVRNAAIHGGTINIDSPASPSGTWNGLTYGYAQRGRRIFKTDLGSADLIFLTIDVCRELDQIGAPFAPS